MGAADDRVGGRHGTTRADSGGIVVMPRLYLDQLYTKLMRHKDRMEVYMAAVKRGEFSNAWVDRQLEGAGCDIEG